MRDATRAGSGPTRRVVTLGVVGAAVVGLSGCGIRLEDDAPRVPLVPTREPIDAEFALVRLLQELRAAALAPVVASVPVSALLAGFHERQATVLHDALRQRGVPEATLTANPFPTESSTPGTPTASTTPTPGASASGSAAASPTTAPPTGAAAVAVSELALVAVGGSCAEADAELRPTILAIVAQCGAAAELATGKRVQGGSVAEWNGAKELAPLITATRTATYFLEVAAARSDRKVLAALRSDLDILRSVTSDLVAGAGDTSPAAELGHPLPFPVDTAADVTRLVTESLETLLQAWGSSLDSLGSTHPEQAFVDVPNWLSSVAAVAHRRGVPLTAFPGLE
ncbi:hypothetical protein N802_19530 [Knoellia sinensis KCTC 19936]|uniref:DUF4439 domain-containing protein n=1 Tax=Knoellia sinensis KCTC 19936 TaxID=1385520 RepID=A0A0A0J8M4_9MICO|nr:DUF4439 domain-containing protein [Knoellia sinensis]KGN31966.1 hypothetical protein N802_19530 [Knoellia sinensis KCTC 19936]